MNAETKERFAIPATVPGDRIQLAFDLLGCVNSTLIFLNKKRRAPGSLLCVASRFASTPCGAFKGAWHFEEYIHSLLGVGLAANQLHIERDFAQIPGLIDGR